MALRPASSGVMRLEQNKNHPRRVSDRWTSQPSYLGKNEVINAGLIAIRRAIRIFLERQQTGVAYSIFSDPTAAINKAMTD